MKRPLISPNRGRMPKSLGKKIAAAEQKERESARVEQLIFAELPPPQSGPQRLFMETTADIAIYGGSAYSGKSFCLLLAYGQQAKNPDFQGVIFRRTSPQITNEGGLFDTAGKLYLSVGATPHLTTHEYRFLSGATVRFAHLQHEKTKYDWQGSQLDWLSYDELTHFTKGQFFYLLSRVRSPSGIPTKIRATTNPDAESWVAELIAWWIDPEGYPNLERAGVIRWFVRLDGDLVWGDSWEDLHDRYPDQVSKPGNYLSTKASPLSFTFIPASIYDNPMGLQADPTYLAKLNALHPVERDRLLKGNWLVKFSAGKVFSRAWFAITPPEEIARSTQSCRYWDIAATAAENAEDSHYYTAGTKMQRAGARYTVLHSLWEQVGPSEVEGLILRTAQADGKSVRIRYELEGGAEAKIWADRFRTKLRSLGFNADWRSPRGDKLTRAIPYATAAYEGNVDLQQGTWNEKYLDCCVSFDGSRKPLVNDVIDSSTGAFTELSGQNPSEPQEQPQQRDLRSRRVFG
jgi:phage terminase large subunit-like protein